VPNDQLAYNDQGIIVDKRTEPLMSRQQANQAIKELQQRGRRK
jgi:hypothetical protein